MAALRWPLLLFAVGLCATGCSKSVGILPLMKSMRVSGEDVIAVPSPAAAVVQMNRKDVRDLGSVTMSPRDVLTVADGRHFTCDYTLLSVRGQVATLQQESISRRPKEMAQRAKVR